MNILLKLLSYEQKITLDTNTLLYLNILTLIYATSVWIDTYGIKNIKF